MEHVSVAGVDVPALGFGTARMDDYEEQYRAVRWLLQQPMVSTVPMSSSPAHVRENADVFDFELSDGEMRELFEVTGGIDDDLAEKIGL